MSIDPEMTQSKVSVMILLFILTVYLLLIEVVQLWKQKQEYFLTPWNYLDFIPPILLIIYMSFDVKGQMT